jgi:hypothetical protein
VPQQGTVSALTLVQYLKDDAMMLTFDVAGREDIVDVVRLS